MTASEFEAWCRAWHTMPSDDDFWSDTATSAMRIQLEAAERAQEIAVERAEVWAKAVMWAAFWPSLAAVLWKVL